MWGEIFYMHLPFVKSHDFINNRKTYAHTHIRLVLIASRISTVKFFSNKWYIFLWNSNTIITKFNNIICFCFFCGACERAVFSRIFTEVGDNIIQNLNVIFLMSIKNIFFMNLYENFLVIIW